jgi:AcrR family transcriptional regulator
MIETKKGLFLKEQILAFKKELILQRVSELLENEGFAGLTMQRIANYCNISVGALYKLFASKEDLFYAYVHYQIDLFMQKLQEGFLRLATPEEKLRFFIELKFKTFKDKKKILLDTIAADPLFFAKLNVTKNNPAQKIYLAVAEVLEEMGVKDPLKLSYALNGLTLGFLEYWLANNGELDKDYVYDMFIKSIKDRP